MRHPLFLLAASLLLSAAGAFAGPMFDTPVNYDLSGQFYTPRAICAADFNNDGLNDLAVGGAGYPTQVSILICQPGRTFAEPYGVESGVLYGYRTLSAADFDGDGNMDIAAAGGESGGDLVIMWGDGTGHFPTNEALTNVDEWVVWAGCVADLDGDGRRDDVAVTADKQAAPGVYVLVMTYDGGAFTLQGTYEIGAWPEEILPLSICAADLNGDGSCDLATANYGTTAGSKISIFFQAAGGGFGPAVHYEFWWWGLSSICALDVQSDGDYDLAFGSTIFGELLLLLNSAGTFSIYETAPYYEISSLAAADLDNDGDEDLAIGHNYQNFVSVRLFGPGGQGQYDVGGLTSAVCASDLDGDGYFDVAAALEYPAGVSILYNILASGPVDSDGDGIADPDDNCPDTPNPGQDDLDLDGVGDVCDNCPDVANSSQDDTDSDGFGDVCDACPGFDDNADADGDGVADGCDICPGYDDLVDTDGDGVPDGCDNCPDAYNPGQEDSDANGVGDVCDYIPGDADGDGNTSLADVLYLIRYIFRGGPAPEPFDAGDVNCDGNIDIGDVRRLIDIIFRGVSPDCP